MKRDDDDQQFFDFDGHTYEPEFDQERLGKQSRAVFKVMNDSQWRTLGEIEKITRYPQASISARLRDYRKEKFGSHTVLRRRLGDPKDGLFEYCLMPNSAPDSQACAPESSGHGPNRDSSGKVPSNRASH